MVCEGPEWARLRRGVSSMSEPASTVPASVRDIHVAHRALEGGGVPEVVDMSLDDLDRESQGPLSGSRFEALSDRAEDSEREVVVAACPRRRLVLLSQNAEPVASDHEWDPDTESLEGGSDVEEEDVPEASVLKTPILAERIQVRARAFASLDSVNFVDTFYHRPRLMQSVPWVLRGAFRPAIHEAFKRFWQGQLRMMS